MIWWHIVVYFLIAVLAGMGVGSGGLLIAFLTFVSDVPYENAVGANLTVRPLREGAELADYMKPQAEIKLFANYDEGWVSENKTTITELYTEHLEASMD